MSRSARLIAAALVALPLLAGAGEGQTRAQALAVDLARTTMPEANWNAIMAQYRAALAQQVDAAMNSTVGNDPASKVPPEVMDRLKAVMLRELDAALPELVPPYEAMIDLVAGILSKYYTEPELAALVAFYASPVGQKSIRIQPEVMRDAMAASQAHVAAKMPTLFAGMQARVKAELVEFDRERQERQAPAKGGP